MGHMPYWLAKTPEMLAMDRYFGLQNGASVLEDRYRKALLSIAGKSLQDLVQTRDVETAESPVSPAVGATLSPAWTHFNKDWINLNNLNSGGDYWPQIPSWRIIILLQQGFVSAIKKALGAQVATANGDHVDTLFRYELEVDPGGDFDTVLPLVTLWVCSSGPGTINFDVDALRGPTAVQLVFATPAPYQQSHIWDSVQPQLDAYWQALHPETPLPDKPPDPIPPREREPDA